MLLVNPLKIDEAEIIYLAKAACHEIDRIYLHWTAGHYGQAYDDYHLNIDMDGTVHRTCRSLTEEKAHTWQRNGRSIGIALECGYRASVAVPVGAREEELFGVTAGSKRLRPLLSAEVNYGPEKPTAPQIECLAKITALLCRHLELPITEETVMTHAEAAIADGYGPCSGDPEMRWDLWFLPDGATGSGIYPGGGIIRAKAVWYQLQDVLA
ncbi:MAG: N-acetylmuramoyl-L-alanine amidase [Acidaminococcaceae bacterium]|nr:N-acetylmuramoyl-L-alanine amidase [Acidaminococcaceae bacterium]